MSYNSKYKGAEAEALLDKVALPDMEMTDDSANLVTTGVIKEYVDLHPQYEEVEDVLAPESDITPKRARMRFIRKNIYVDCSESFGESKEVQLARLGRHYSQHRPADGSDKYNIVKHGWRIYNYRTTMKGDRDRKLYAIYLEYEGKAHGYYRYRLMLEIGDKEIIDATPQNILGCFGIAGEQNASLRHGHKLALIPAYNYYASQTYAIVIDGAYLPFRLTAHWSKKNVCYGGTPLSI